MNTLARFNRNCDEIDDTGQVWHSKSNLLLVVSYPLKAKSIIPICNWNANYVKGGFRKEIAENFDRTRYSQRNKVETVFSVIKRKFGDEIKSRIFRSQAKELKLKCIVYSLDLFLKNKRIFITD